MEGGRREGRDGGGAKRGKKEGRPECEGKGGTKGRPVCGPKRPGGEAAAAAAALALVQS